MSNDARNTGLPEDVKLGATGEFPEGKVNEHDEGEITLAVVSREGKVFVEFGKPVAWLAFGPLQAKQFALSLMTASLSAQGINVPMEMEPGGNA